MSFTIGDVVVILGFAWQFFNYVRRLEALERRIKEQEKLNKHNWKTHIEPMSQTISEWEGTVGKPGRMRRLEQDIEAIKSKLKISDTGRL